MCTKGGLTRFIGALACCMLWISVGYPATACAQPLPAAAAEAYDRARIAIDQKDWNLAIQYLDQAHDAAPASPMIFGSLGVAHAGAGHELPAIAWFNAFIAVSPQAPNAGDVRREL